MKKFLLAIQVLLVITGVAYAQSAASPVQQMDNTVKEVAENIHNKLVEKGVQKMAVGQFTYRGAVPPLCTYWINQLTAELSNIPGRPYIILSGGIAGADWTVSGEIIEVVNIIRIHTRLIRTEGRAVEASLQSDLERTAALAAMLVGGGGGGGDGGGGGGSDGGSSSGVPQDEYEPDSWDYPVPFQIGVGEDSEVMNRTFHNSSDQDFFLLAPDRDARYTMETTGSTDTYMYLYDYDTRALLTEDDDGGTRYNARIRYNLQAGKRYLVKLEGLGGEMGSYGFRAFSSGGGMLPQDEYEPDDESSRATPIEIGTPQQHTFHSSNDVDWVQFSVTRPGRYTIRSRGVRTDRLDTYIELFDTNLNAIADDDDGGSNLDSRLSLHLENGLYYLKVWCIDEEPDQPYTISVEAE
jgi:hypothetical protein